MEMHVLTPGVFVEELPAIQDEQENSFKVDQNRQDTKKKMLYPIQIDLREPP
jgi:hypothetical protein